MMSWSGTIGRMTLAAALGSCVFGCDVIDDLESDDDAERQLEQTRAEVDELEDELADLKKASETREADGGSDQEVELAALGDEREELLEELDRVRQLQDEVDEQDDDVRDVRRRSDEIQTWMRRAKQIPGGHTYSHDDDLIVLASLGKKNVAGLRDFTRRRRAPKEKLRHRQCQYR